jgi:hypothetical protein
MPLSCKHGGPARPSPPARSGGSARSRLGARLSGPRRTSSAPEGRGEAAFSVPGEEGSCSTTSGTCRTGYFSLRARWPPMSERSAVGRVVQADLGRRTPPLWAELLLGAQAEARSLSCAHTAGTLVQPYSSTLPSQPARHMASLRIILCELTTSLWSCRRG